MSEEATLDQLPLMRSLASLREKATARLELQLVHNVEREHMALPEGSPSWSYVETFYLSKLSLGKLNIDQVKEKVNTMVSLSKQEREHIVRHLEGRPPSEEEIERAMDEERAKIEGRERRRMEKAREDLQAATVEKKVNVQGLTIPTGLLEGKRIRRRGRTLVFKDGQLYVFRRGRRGRQKLTRHYKAMERLLRADSVHEH